MGGGWPGGGAMCQGIDKSAGAQAEPRRQPQREPQRQQSLMMSGSDWVERTSGSNWFQDGSGNNKFVDVVGAARKAASTKAEEAPTIIRYLPVASQKGEPLLEHQGENHCRVNTFNGRGVDYRCSKEFADKAAFGAGVDEGEEVIGTDAGDGWIKVEIKGGPASKKRHDLAAGDVEFLSEEN